MNNQILGDKKKSNFDDNLADVVNELAEKGELRGGNVIEISSDKNVVFYEDFAYKNEKRTLDDWLNNWPCSVSHMPSMPELYLIGKQNKGIPENLRILTRTILQRDKPKKRGFEFKHDKNSSNDKDKIFFVRHYTGEDLETELEKNPTMCEVYLRTLFDTRDSTKQILESLKNLSRKKNIVLATPPYLGHKFMTLFYATKDNLLLTSRQALEEKTQFPTIGVKYES